MGQACDSRHAHLIESPQFFVFFPMFSSSHIKNWMNKFLNCFSLKLADWKPWKRGQLLELRTCSPSSPWLMAMAVYSSVPCPLRPLLYDSSIKSERWRFSDRSGSNVHIFNSSLRRLWFMVELLPKSVKKQEESFFQLLNPSHPTTPLLRPWSQSQLCHGKVGIQDASKVGWLENIAPVKGRNILTI
jgi:hypothetical protein